MKKTFIFSSGVIQVVIIQLMISIFLAIFLHRVLLRADDPELFIRVMLRVSSDEYSFEIMQELIQFTLWVPAMMYLYVRLIRPIDIDYSYLIIRHQLRPMWYLKNMLNILLLSLTAAATTLLVFLGYFQLVMGRQIAWPFSSVLLLMLSLFLGIFFYVLLTVLLTINRPVIVMMLILVLLLALGKLLIHVIPVQAEYMPLTATMLNHFFVINEDYTQVVKEPAKVVTIIAADLAAIGLLCLINYQRIIRINFIGRKT